MLPPMLPEEERGPLRHAPTAYGRSLWGAPLQVYLPASGKAELLVFAAIHGHEPDSAVVVSAALRCLSTLR